MPDALISCVIAVHNGADLLERAVRSVLVQKGPIEVIVVDDASTDGTAEQIATLGRQNAAVRGIRMPTNRGPGFCRNAGAQASRGSMLAFLDHDDEFLPGWFEVARLALARHPEAAAVEMRSEVVGLPPDLEEKARQRREAVLRRGNSSLALQHNIVVRRALVPNFLWFPSSQPFRGEFGGEDLAFMTALARLYRLVRVDKEFHRHHCDRPGNHLARLLRQTDFTDKGPIARAAPPEVADGSFNRALKAHLEACMRRRDEFARMLPSSSGPTTRA
jgi:glycosyltransferase involved in cell wall biosynthesis